MLAEAWTKAATISIAESAFKSTGIYPYNPDIIPEYAYLSDPSSHNQNNVADATERQSDARNDTVRQSKEADDTMTDNQDQEGLADQVITPGKQLDQDFPVPSTSKVQTVRIRGRQLAQVLTSPENIQKRKCLSEKKKKITDKKEEQTGSKTKKSYKGKEIKAKTSRKRKLSSSSSSEEETGVVLQSDTESEDFGYSCVGCGEIWEQTKSKEDWIQCITCKRWLHENCTSFPNHCLPCGRKN